MILANIRCKLFLSSSNQNLEDLLKISFSRKGSDHNSVSSIVSHYLLSDLTLSAGWDGRCHGYDVFDVCFGCKDFEIV